MEYQQYGEGRFLDRREAGRRLAHALREYAGNPDVLVLALPRGGVPVAHEVAQALSAPLDVFVVRKLGVPGQEELAMGALASGGIRVLNDDVVQELRLDSATIDAVTRREQQTLEQREQSYRKGRPAAAVEDRILILVDDGLATGATMRAAVEALRTKRPQRLIVAVPVAPVETCETLRAEADDVVCLLTPPFFMGVGRWYQDFSQTTDDEVRELLRSSSEPR